MNFDQAFSIANTAALAGWFALLLLPRWPALVAVLRYGLIGGLSVAYTVLIMLFFFRVEGGGFNSIAEVRALFMSDGGLLAGWIHYLAFDLFIGMRIALEADRLGMGRLLQAPILVATFMFGPIGLLMYFASRAAVWASLFTART
ncbi:LytS/YehU family sensor histidine kinase (plasmid) [Ensifer sp. WSM1721]|uniref:ABA4-like family protein n=1 Tax=Ensifer sp. WSM1721 TaxID=1041159 RepID=UPI00047D9264|nr:ABA4-like family protein [Ensifer sp. WSM1721]